LENGNITGLHFRQLVLTLSEGCNYRCRHCLCGDEALSGKGSFLTYDDVIKIIDLAAEVGTFYVIGFVGGEPFLRYHDMLKISDYVHKNYECPLTVSTNSYWATTYDAALEKLKPLVERGLVSMLVSLGDFHLEFGTLQTAGNAIKAALKLGVRCTAQDIITKRSRRIDQFRKMLEPHLDTTKVDWIDNDMTHSGNAENYIPYEDLLKKPLEPGDCSIEVNFNVQPDGSVKPCCGGGLKAKRLTMGNAKTESIGSIIERMQTNPLINALIIWKGPYYLAKLLADNGHVEYLQRDYAGSCDACYKILTDDRAWSLLEPILEKEKIRLFVHRTLVMNYNRLLSDDKKSQLQI
jgi:organic radical activating enzyme